MGRPVHRQFLRNALPDLTTIVPVTAYERINYVRDTVGLSESQHEIVIGMEHRQLML